MTKLPIIGVGTFNDEGLPVGWTFGPLPKGYDGPAIWISPPSDAPADILIGGYTLDELRAIAELDAVPAPFYPPEP